MIKGEKTWEKAAKHLTAFVLACAMMTQAAPIAPALAADAEGYTPVVTTDKQYTGYENGNGGAGSDSDRPL